MQRTSEQSLRLLRQSMDDVPNRPGPSDSTAPLPQLVTPEAIPAAYVHRFGGKPFYLFARFVAFLIDGCGVTFLLATFAFNARTHGAFLSAPRGEGGYVAILAGAFGIAVIFAFVCEALFGTTIGKLVFALHVRTLEGRHVGAGPVLMRTLLYPIDFLFVGLVFAATTRRRQRLGDMLAKTVVSNGSIGAFASVIGVAIVIALAYAQAAYAGGVRSVDGFASQTREYTPGIIAHATSIFHGDGSGVPAVAQSESPAPAIDVATAAPTAEPNAEPATEAPSSDASPNP